MKTYFRLLSFAKPIEKFAIPYILYTLLYIVFSTFVLVLIGPLLNTLFGLNVGLVAQTGKQPGMFDLTGWFQYYMVYFASVAGQWAALKFVCVIVIVAVVLGNIFRYLSARIMENLRIHTLYNLRKTV